MKVKVTEYVNKGEGFKEVGSVSVSDAEAKNTLEHLRSEGFKRVIGSGIIGIEMEFKGKDYISKVTFEKVLS